jgi:hypothetical protein
LADDELINSCPEKVTQYLCLDKAYDNKTGDGASSGRATSSTSAASARGSSTRPA